MLCFLPVLCCSPVSSDVIFKYRNLLTCSISSPSRLICISSFYSRDIIITFVLDLFVIILLFVNTSFHTFVFLIGASSLPATINMSTCEGTFRDTCSFYVSVSIIHSNLEVSCSIPRGTIKSRCVFQSQDLFK